MTSKKNIVVNSFLLVYWMMYVCLAVLKKTSKCNIYPSKNVLYIVKLIDVYL